jgi:hypothetical protein
MEQPANQRGESWPAGRALERWHEMLTSRYVCEACMTRYFMTYRKCKACGKVGRIRRLTTSLFELADNDAELREMIANGQRILFGELPAENAASEVIASQQSSEPVTGDYEI